MKPIICNFRQLAFALRSLHRWEKTALDDLHDVWTKGGPTPDSRIQQPKGYDPRLAQAGNLEKRIVLPTPLAAWVKDVGTRRGIAMTPADARKLVGAIQKARSQR